MNGCLEDTTNTSRISCAHRFATTTSVQRESRITPMRRICSFTDFYSMHLDYVRQGAWIFTDFSFAWGNPAPSGAMKSVTHPRVNKIREKIKSVASVLSVIHFERVRKSPKALEHCDYLWSFIHHHVLITSRRTDQDASGTVFQTAFLLAFIIPRLRPGLLSLRSV